MKKDVLISGIALVLGGTAGFLICKTKLEKKYAALAEESIRNDVASVKERLEDKCNKCQFRKPRVDAAKTNANKSEKSVFGERSNGYAEAKRNYNLGESLVRDVARYEPNDANTEDNEPDEDLRDGEILRMEETGDLEPYLISDIEFSEGCPHYDKLTCYYYGDDDTMTDEHERLMFEDDRDRTLGARNVIDGFDTPNPKIIWIRNERLGSDYEVIFVNGSYQDIISGNVKGGMSPREQQEARMKRKEAKRREN